MQRRVLCSVYVARLLFLETVTCGSSSLLVANTKISQTNKPYTTPFVMAFIKGAYTAAGILNHVGTMLPGKSGTGTAKDAKVNKRKNAAKIAFPRNSYTPLNQTQACHHN